MRDNITRLQACRSGAGVESPARGTQPGGSTVVPYSNFQLHQGPEPGLGRDPEIRETRSDGGEHDQVREGRRLALNIDPGRTSASGASRGRRDTRTWIAALLAVTPIPDHSANRSSS
jgi:hypothetical protein